MVAVRFVLPYGTGPLRELWTDEDNPPNDALLGKDYVMPAYTMKER